MMSHTGPDTIKWGYIFGEVFMLYLRLFGIFMAYHFTKIYTAQNRSSANPRRLEKVWRYGGCVVVVCLINLFAAANITGDEDEGRTFEGWSYNRGLIVFFTLLVAVLVGAADGFRIADKDIPHASPSSDDEW